MAVVSECVVGSGKESQLRRQRPLQSRMRDDIPAEQVSVSDAGLISWRKIDIASIERDKSAYRA